MDAHIWITPDETQQSQDRPKRRSMAQISVPSFSSFKERVSSIPVPPPLGARRQDKASPRAVSFYHSPSPQPCDASLRARPYSLDSPLPQQETGLVDVSTALVTAEDYFEQASSLHFPTHEHLPPVAHSKAVSVHSGRHRGSTPESSRAPVPLDNDKRTGPGHLVNFSVSSTTSAPAFSDEGYSITMSTPGQTPTMTAPGTPAMTVQLDGIPRSFTDESTESFASSSSPRRSKSKLTSFFGWKSSSPNLSGSPNLGGSSPNLGGSSPNLGGSSPNLGGSSPNLGGNQSPVTSFSDMSVSPGHSRDTSHFDVTPTNLGLTPPVSDAHRPDQSQYFDVPGTPFLSHSPAVNAHVEELERELKQVSSELAGSIRREMELEDEVERYRIEMPPATHELTRRTSDYFSDSGASSLRYPIGDSDAKIEELERFRRKAEQEKAQMQVDYAQKLADELRARKNLESQIHQLEEELHEKHGEDTVDDAENADRVKELELFLDEARRRLSQERQSKDNFEDLFAALRDETEKYRNERDNLRDEVVPQLQALVEGLEVEAAETQSLRYENARMQQEVLELRTENQMLQEAQDSAAPRMSEDSFAPPRWGNKAGLSRSNSLARSSSVTNLKRSNSLARSGSVKERSERQRSDSISVSVSNERIPGERISNDRVKDIEDQRDALHKALRNLLCRYDNQKLEHSKALRKMAAARDHARNAVTGRTPFTREVNMVRQEHAQLRRRADDALDQKWQVESNIGGVKMALDRAQQETRSLREYLNGRTVEGSPRKSTVAGLGIEIADDSVELGEEDRKTMIKVLRQSIALAETERDAALREAEGYRQKAQVLLQSEDEYLDTEQDLAEQLLQAAARMEQLASQVQEHLQANLELRERLGQAVGKGEEQQSDSTARIVGMQSRLKMMEENVMAAQQQSESALGNHEEEAKQIENANSPKLQRLNVAASSAVLVSPLFGVKSPKIGASSSGKAENLFEASQTTILESRVKELEAALTEADSEMKEVVQRINYSQFEIAELQGERDEAHRQMRRLQAQISDEKTKAQALLTV